MTSLLLGLACGTFVELVERPVPHGVEEPASAQAVDGQAFRVAPLGDAQLLSALLHHSRAGIPGWRVMPFERGGNFVRWRACSPTVSDAACEGGAVANDTEPGTGWRELSTLTYDSEWPVCSGVIYSAGEMPAGSGWGVTVRLGVNGGSIVGDGFEATAVQLVEGAVARRVVLTPGEVVVGAKTLTLETNSPRTEALALVASPENLTATVSQRYAALIAKVDAASAAGTITVWREGPYLGGGIPPEQTEVPAAPSEAAALADAARSRLIADRDLALGSADEIHRLLARLLPARVLKP